MIQTLSVTSFLGAAEVAAAEVLGTPVVAAAAPPAVAVDAPPDVAVAALPAVEDAAPHPVASRAAVAVARTLAAVVILMLGSPCSCGPTGMGSRVGWLLFRRSRAGSSSERCTFAVVAGNG
jgi:hypothetical protein